MAAAKTPKTTEKKEKETKKTEAAAKGAESTKRKTAKKSTSSKTSSAAADEKNKNELSGEGPEEQELDVAKLMELAKPLLATAKKKKNALEYQEIVDQLQGQKLSDREMKVIEVYLEQQDIDILRIRPDAEEPDDEMLLITEEDLAEEDEPDVENIDLTVPEGVSIEDPVRM